jgi:phospholipid/cholesterol/gamma-HCH transport system permease protein
MLIVRHKGPFIPSAAADRAGRGRIDFIQQTEGTLLVRLAGSWRMGKGLASADEVEKQLEAAPQVRTIAFDAEGLTAWDSGLLTFLIKVKEQCAARGIEADASGLPQGAQRLLALALAVPERKGARREAGREPLLARIGGRTLNVGRSTGEVLDFIGGACVALLQLLLGKARFRGSEFWLIVQESSARALPIVSLISLLVGLILAFVGAVQLKMFGAEIYVASLVGIAMVRVMGAIMTGIIMAGRTGAAFAAELGTMQVNEEIDALSTLGVSPMEFLVLPRLLALTVMMPLLCLYADLMGILGGFIVGVGMLDLNPMEYVNQTRASVGLSHLWVGLFHSAVFGVLVSLTGCLRGMQCGRSASAVGDAATSAVVTGIVGIIVSTAVLTVICNFLGI